MLDIDKFIALVEEEGPLWDKNEVARAWKKVNQVLKNCAIKSRSVNCFGWKNCVIWIQCYSKGLGAIFPCGNYIGKRPSKIILCIFVKPGLHLLVFAKNRRERIARI